MFLNAELSSGEGSDRLEVALVDVPEEVVTPWRLPTHCRSPPPALLPPGASTQLHPLLHLPYCTARPSTTL